MARKAPRSGHGPETLQEAILFFSDYENCKKAVEAVRWPDGLVKCPTCGSQKVTYLENQRRWKCYEKHPKAQFSLKVGTIFEDSPIGLEKWLPALWLVTTCKNGISSYELARALDVTQKSAWFMLSRLRLALQAESGGKLGGEVRSMKPSSARGPATCTRRSASGSASRRAVRCWQDCRYSDSTIAKARTPRASHRPEPTIRHLFNYVTEGAGRYTHTLRFIGD
jgi:transposase-like protein